MVNHYFLFFKWLTSASTMIYVEAVPLFHVHMWVWMLPVWTWVLQVHLCGGAPGVEAGAPVLVDKCRLTYSYRYAFLRPPR
jgi:hypothetical protein